MRSVLTTFNTTDVASRAPYPAFQEGNSTYVVLVYLLVLPICALLGHTLWQWYQRCWEVTDEPTDKQEHVFIPGTDMGPIMTGLPPDHKFAAYISLHEHEDGNSDVMRSAVSGFVSFPSFGSLTGTRMACCRLQRSAQDNNLVIGQMQGAKITPGETTKGMAASKPPETFKEFAGPVCKDTYLDRVAHYMARESIQPVPTSGTVSDKADAGKGETSLASTSTEPKLKP